MIYYSGIYKAHLVRRGVDKASSLKLIRKLIIKELAGSSKFIPLREIQWDDSFAFISPIYHASVILQIQYRRIDSKRSTRQHLRRWTHMIFDERVICNRQINRVYDKSERTMAKPSRLQDERNREICKYIYIQTLQRDALGNRVTDIALRQPDIRSLSEYPARSGIRE